MDRTLKQLKNPYIFSNIVWIVYNLHIQIDSYTIWYSCNYINWKFIQTLQIITITKIMVTYWLVKLVNYIAYAVILMYLLLYYNNGKNIITLIENNLYSNLKLIRSYYSIFPCGLDRYVCNFVQYTSHCRLQFIIIGHVILNLFNSVASFFTFILSF